MKKFISLFLVVSILLLSGNMFAKERKGANIEIFKTKQIIKLEMEGTPWEKLNLEPDIRGELIAVKEYSILLLDRDTGADVTVDIEDIGTIRIVKKSKAGMGMLYGALIGGGGGALIGGRWGVMSDETGYSLFLGVLGGVGGLLIGAIIGAAAGKDKTIQIEGKSDSEIQEILEKLRKKARIRNSH